MGSWYVAVGPAGAERLTVAGRWDAFVSLNLFRFVLLRWYFRLIVWYSFRWRVSRLPLRLNPLHPDRAGGRGFIGNSVRAFQPVLVAHTVVLAGLVGGRIWYEGMKLPAFQIEIVGAVALLMAIVLAPLTFFVLNFARAKREGARQYGLLAMRYVDEFREKWMRDRRSAGEPLVGSADIQSLADLASDETAHADDRHRTGHPRSVHAGVGAGARLGLGRASHVGDGGRVGLRHDAGHADVLGPGHRGADRARPLAGHAGPRVADGLGA